MNEETREWIRTLKSDLKLLKNGVKEGTLDYNDIYEHADGLLYGVRKLEECLHRTKN